MDDKELVEVWRKEFESAYEKRSPYGFEVRHGEYIDDDVEAHWKTFLMAKRSQPSVVLPDIDDYWDGLERDYDTGKYEKDLHARLTAAGIKYTVGE